MLLVTHKSCVPSPDLCKLRDAERSGHGDSSLSARVCVAACDHLHSRRQTVGLRLSLDQRMKC